MPQDKAGLIASLGEYPDAVIQGIESPWTSGPLDRHHNHQERWCRKSIFGRFSQGIRICKHR